MGSRYDDEVAANAGAAYIYKRNGGSWDLEQKLLASDGQADDRFGWQVGITTNRAIVAARFNDEAGADAGAAYVFDYEDGQWSEEAKLIGSQSGAGDQFGQTVDISSDYAIVGAWLADAQGANSGEAYLFERVDDVWMERLHFLAPGGAEGDRFGFAHMDSRHVAIGAVYDDNPNGVDAGAVYVAPLPVTAQLSASQTRGVSPLDTRFTDESAGNATSWSWDFGDGQSSSLQNPVHTYTQAGLYTVELTVSGPCGSSTTVRPDLVRVLYRPVLHVWWP